jgi:hypothetical protein
VNGWLLVADLGRPTMFARIDVTKALNRHVKRIFNSDRKGCAAHAERRRAVKAQSGDDIALGEARSACTCEECGEVARLYRHVGRYQTLCSIHAKGMPVAASGDGLLTETLLRRPHIAKVCKSAEADLNVKRDTSSRAADALPEMSPGLSWLRR